MLEELITIILKQFYKPYYCFKNFIIQC